MPVRCWNFNNDGSVKQKCSKGSDCRFVHPDHPDWSRASKPMRGREFSRDSWGAPPTITSTSKAGPPASRRPSSSQALSPTDSWGSSKRNDTLSQPSSSLTNGSSTSDQYGWGSVKPRSTNGKGKDTGWDEKDSGRSGSRRSSESSDKGWGLKEDNTKAGESNEKDSGWGSKKVGNWGTPKPIGWGNRDSGWGTEASGSGWGGAGTSSWGASNPWKADGEAKPENEPIQASSWEVGSGWGSKPKPPPPAKQSAVTKDPRKERPRISISLPTGPAGPVTRDEPLSGKTMTPGTPLRSTKENTKMNLTSVTPCGITVEPAEPAPESPHSTTEHANPMQIYSTTIRSISRAVMLQIDLDIAHANIDRWKRTQNSLQFIRATPATQVLLDNQLLEYVREANDLKKRLDVAIKRLVQQPNFHSQPLAEISRHKLVAYSAEIRNWIQTLKKRAESTSPSDPKEEEKPHKPNDPKESVWDQIQATLTSIDDTAEFAADILRDRRLTADVDSKMSALRESHEAIRRDHMATIEAPIKEASHKTSEIESDIEDVAKEIASIMKMVYQNQHILAQLTAELEKAQKFNSQTQKMLSQLAELKQRDDARIQELTKQLRSLHNITPPPRSPIDVGSLVSRSQALFLDDARCEITTLFDQIRQACSEVHRGFIAQATQQFVNKTDVYHRPDEITS